MDINDVRILLSKKSPRLLLDLILFVMSMWSILMFPPIQALTKLNDIRRILLGKS